MATIKRMMPRIPLDAKRWIFEMEEIARTYDTLGMTPHFHQGAAAMMQLADQTPLARRTRETAQDDTALADVLQIYVDALRAKP